ncbi:hypothetical protein G9A89_022896 [Geosiphon pyriformis]|nr:hypothetical protein G9A89_022896 [Geosiphon pyriformis]
MSGVISNLPNEKARNTSGNCKDSLRKDPKQWVDFSSASKKEYINTHNNQELKNNLYHNSKKKAFSVTKGVFMNTCSIVLIETARKILSKIFLNRIFFVCSKFNVLRGDNFSVLKDMTTQSPIFTIGLVIKNALEKNHKLESLVRIKMCNKFIWFFGNIHNGQCIFYDLLLCEVKRQKSVYGYKLDSHFMTKTGCSKSWAGLTSFFTAGAFVNNTIWVQAEGKSASVVSFVNSVGILGHLFAHRSHDLTPMSVILDVGLSNILESHEFEVVYSCLLEVNSGHLSLFTDGFLSRLGTLGMKAGAAVFFKDIDLSLGVGMFGLVFSTIAELQAIALALKCIPPFHLVNLFLDSQAALDACKSEFMLTHLDFKNWYWIKHHHIANVICCKNLVVNWVKVRGHSGVLGNEHANAFAGAAAFSNMYLLHIIDEHFLRAGGTAVSDFYLAAGFTSAQTAGFQTYFIKTLYHHLLVAVYKHLYSRSYPSVICLFCRDVEVSNHVFSCPFNAAGHAWLVEVHASAWEAHLGLSRFSLCVSWFLSTCISNVTSSNYPVSTKPLQRKAYKLTSDTHKKRDLEITKGTGRQELAKDLQVNTHSNRIFLWGMDSLSQECKPAECLLIEPESILESRCQTAMLAKTEKNEQKCMSAHLHKYYSAHQRPPDLDSETHTFKTAWLSKHTSTEQEEGTHSSAKATACNSAIIKDNRPTTLIPMPNPISEKNTTAPSATSTEPSLFKKPSVKTEIEPD